MQQLKAALQQQGSSPQGFHKEPISGSIPSKKVNNVFLAQVMLSTKSTPLVHVLALLDSGANSYFMDQNLAQAS